MRTRQRQRDREERRARTRRARVRDGSSASQTKLALALERLEARQMLAITVTEQNLAGFKVGADYIFEDDSSITVADDLVIDAAGGEISLTAPAIMIGAGGDAPLQGHRRRGRRSSHTHGPR